MRNMRAIAAVIWLCGCVATWSGCAAGNTHRYHDVSLNLQATGDRSVGVATHDEREYILSGKKHPDFVGLSRGGCGNTFDIRTASRKTLAEDMTTAIESALRKKGFKPVPVIVSAQEKPDGVMKKLIETKADRLILVTLKEWKSDTYTNTGLNYDVTLAVHDSQGKVVAQKSIQGHDNLKGSVWNPPSHAKKAVPVAFAQKFEELLNSADVKAALQ